MEKDILQYIVGTALTIYPVWRIIKRTGLNPNWAAILVIPGLGAIAILLMLAFSDWPLNQKRGL